MREADDGASTTDDVRWPDPERWGSPARAGADLDRGGDPPWPDRPEGWWHDAPDPPEAFPVPWSWTDALLIIAWFVLANVILGTVLMLAGVDVLGDDTALLGFAAGVQTVVLLGALVWLAVRGALSWRLLGPLPPRWKHALVGLGIGVVGWLGVTLVLALAMTALDRDALPTQETLERIALGDVGTIVLGLGVAVVIAPIVEEFIYRSVLFQALRERIGVFPAMAISALVFGTMHLETVFQEGEFAFTGLIPMMGIVLLGFWLAAVFHKTGSLVVPIVGHAVFNAIAVAMALVTFDGGPPVGALSLLVGG